MKKFALRIAFLLACALVALPAAAAPLDSFSGLAGSLDIAGGTAHIPVMKEAAKRIMRAQPDIRITVAGGGSGVGVQKVGEGLVAIGNTGRPVSDKEQATYGLQSFPFAIDGVAAIVHPSNPITSLSAQQIRDIFAGKIANWKELGGQDAPVTLYARDEASGTRAVFWKKLLKKGPVADSANIVPSNGAMKVAVSQDPAAIGYMSIGHVDAAVQALLLDGVAPSQENATSGAYPVVRKLYMNTKGAPSPLAQAFIDYILTSEGAEIVRQAGYLSLQ